MTTLQQIDLCSRYLATMTALDPDVGILFRRTLFPLLELHDLHQAAARALRDIAAFERVVDVGETRPVIDERRRLAIESLGVVKSMMLMAAATTTGGSHDVRDRQATGRSWHSSSGQR